MDAGNFPMKELLEISGFTSAHPERILGPRIVKGELHILFYSPISKSAWVEAGGRKYEPEPLGKGIYRCKIPLDFKDNYKICFKEESGDISAMHDTYMFAPQIGQSEIADFRQGTLYRSYEIFGAHMIRYPQCTGIRFVVWAPNAVAVSVIGNFNHWIPGFHPMINVNDSGIWELFIPDIQDETYKFAIRTGVGTIIKKTDPYAFYAELRPDTASRSFLPKHEWHDKGWMEKRTFTDHQKKNMSIYEMHPGSWMRRKGGAFLNYRDIAEPLCSYVKDMGFTHVELLPVMEHPLDESWGYQVVNYFAPTSRFGNPDDFRYLVDCLHYAGIGVILDWVPAHFPQDQHGLSLFDGTPLFEYGDPRKGLHPDWGTKIFDYSKGEVISFLISNCIYWLEQFHADGIRIDAVSSMLYLDYSRGPGNWVPNVNGGRENLEAIELFKRLNDTVHKRFPGAIMIAEESTAWPGVTTDISSGGLGFDYKWNMGWMHDTLEFFSSDPINRKHNMNRLTFSLWYAFSERFILPFSHDEVVHGKGSLLGKMPGDMESRNSNLRLLISYMFSFPGKKLLFMGAELGRMTEWDFNSSLIKMARIPHETPLQYLIKSLNGIYSTFRLGETDFSQKAFQWIDFNDTANTVISFIRRNDDAESMLVFVFNFTPVPREGYRIGIPEKGRYRSVFNSDSQAFGGKGYPERKVAVSGETEMHGFPWSLELDLPPLSCLIYMKEKEEMK